MTFARRYIPETIILFIVFFLVLFWAVGRVQDINDGELAYSADDAYIHLAMARSFGEAGVWGVTVHEPSSTTSSPLWTLFLSVFPLVFDDITFLPFVLNIILSLMLIAVFVDICFQWGVNRYLTLLISIVVIFLVPLTTQVLVSMEHLLQAVLALAVVHTILPVLTNASVQVNRWVYVWVVLFALTRYENLFVVAVICGLLVLGRRIGLALKIGIVAIVPIIAYGLYSIAQGGLFLPNSVYVKSTARTTRSLSDILGLLDLGEVFAALSFSGFLLPSLLLVLLVLWRLFKVRSLRHGDIQLALIALGGALLHARFAEMMGLMGRYDVYLFVLYFLAFIVATKAIVNGLSLWIGRAIGVVVLTAMIGFFGSSRLIHFITSIQATHDIYAQQIQMARFLREYDPDATVFANDIGAITLYTNIRLLDLNALGSNQVAVDIAGGQTIDLDYIDELTKAASANIAVIDSRFEVLMPPEWVKLTRWILPTVIIAGDNSVTFYAIDPTIAKDMFQALQEYEPRLPDDVIVELVYESDSE